MTDQRGTTLMEVLIYISIVGIVLTTISSFTINLITIRQKTQASSEVLTNARLIQQRLQDAVRHAEEITTASSTFGSDPGVLQLDMVDAGVDPTIFSLTADDGQFQANEGGAGNITITSDDVEVTNLVFTNLTTASDVGIIQVQFTVRAVNPSTITLFDYEETFQTTLRIPLDQ